MCSEKEYSTTEEFERLEAAGFCVVLVSPVYPSKEV